MENRIAIIKNGVISNVIVAADEFAETLKDQTINVTNIDCEIGWLYDGTNFTAPVKSQEEIEAEAKAWRDHELKSTDFIVPLTDYPNYTAWMAYRQELRDWPSTASFPDTKPIKP